MKKKLRTGPKLKSAVFLLCLVLFFLLFDYLLSIWGENCCPWTENDFDVTRAHHPEETWDKVFFGNSSVISAYREDASTQGYVNLGMDYAVVTDLWQLLKQGHIDVGSELVIGLNLFTLYDDFDTNPSYIWHRGALEPYAYFHRDKLLQMAKDTVKSLLGMEVPEYPMGEKPLYFGTLSDAELSEKMLGYNERYFSLPMEDFDGNIAALDHIADWCEEHGVRLRILWMPFNPSVERPQLMLDLMDTVNAWCGERGIPIGDFTDKMDETCFHDVGHLNYEYGAYVFTQEVDEWLQS